MVFDSQLNFSFCFSRFLLREELGGPEKDLFVFWLVLKKTGFLFCFVLFCFFIIEIVSPFTLCPFTAKTLQAFQSTRWHQNWT